jgi:hypothetical protein
VPSLIKAEPLAGYRVHLTYDDGATGQIDLSHLVGQGVFSAWQEEAFFNRMKIGEFGELSWGNDIELCSDALYLQLTGKTVEEVFTGMREDSHA